MGSFQETYNDPMKVSCALDFKGSKICITRLQNSPCFWEDLTFKQHVSSICKKENNQFSVMTRFGKLMSTEAMLRFYKAFILPHFYYCSMVCHFSSKQDSDKLDLLNKRILRFIFKDFNSEYNKLLKKAGTANLKDKRL